MRMILFILKNFSNLDLAEEWVKLNEPIYSLQDILSVKRSNYDKELIIIDLNKLINEKI